eukprot:EG_transcript_13825
MALGRLTVAEEDAAQLLRLYPESTQATDVQVLFPVSATSAAAVNMWSAQPARRHERGDRSPSPGPSAENLTLPQSTSDLGTPLTPDIFSNGTLSFQSDETGLDLAALPAYAEPPLADPPYLAAFQEALDAQRTPLQYTICSPRVLGQGAFGRVYRALHPKGWFLAVKEVPARYFEQSVDLLAALEIIPFMKHNHVVRCLGLRRLPGCYHVVQEYCSGGTLRGLINDLRGLPMPLIRKYATELLLGLRYMHCHGLLHRDIKASNVLLRGDGVSKLADFGTCIRIPDGGTVTCESAKGTVLWMAPESFRGRYSAVSDVWSFGCTVIEMATAKDPWHEQHFREQLTAMVFIATHRDSLPEPPPQLSDALGSHFFRSCIARDPSERCTADLLLRHPWLSGSCHKSNPNSLATSAFCPP